MADSVLERVRRLKREGALREIEAEVEPHLEAAEILRRLTSRGQDTPLLFTHPRESDFPLLLNLHGSAERWRAACENLDSAQLAARLVGEAHAPAGLFSRRPPAADDPRFLPRTVRAPRSQQVVRLEADLDLLRLPFLRCRPEEQAPMLPGLLLVEGGESDRTAARPALAARLDERRLAIHWPPYDPAWALFEEQAARGEPARAAFVLGPSPFLLLAALLPWENEPPRDVWITAGRLAGGPLAAAPGRTQPTRVPDDAEAVIELEFHLHDARDALPRLAGAGSTTLPTPHACVLEARAVTHAAEAVIPALVPECGRGELAVLAHAVSDLLRPRILAALPRLTGLHFPPWGDGLDWFGPARPVLFAALEKRRPGEGIAAARQLAGLPELAGTRLIVVVDRGIDPAEENAVWRAAAEHALPGRDWQAVDSPPAPLDHAAADPRGSLLLLDATFKLPEEGGARGAVLQGDDAEIRKLVTGRWREYGFPEMG